MTPFPASNNPLNYFDQDGLDKHHVIPQSIWKNMNLSPEVKDLFKNYVIEAGKHNFRDPHSEYNKLIKQLFDEFFKGKKPEQITKCMAEEFIRSLENNPRVKELLREIVLKGGLEMISKTAKYAALRSAGKVGLKFIPIIGWIWMVGDELFNVPELE